nr:tandem-95 repeat protein [Deltaproteobacteria bacterium]
PDNFAAGFATSLDITHATLLANDVDIDSSTLTVSAVTAGSNGTVTMAGSSVTFRPATVFTGVATFTYRVSDGTSTAEANVTVTVGANGAPVATNDTSTTSEDAPVMLTSATLLANDTDPDQNTLSVTNAANATNGTVSLSNGVVTFTPAPDFNGVATFDYVASDGATGDTATVTIQVQPVADAPVANGDAATTAEDQIVTIAGGSLVANDTDVDGNTLQVTAVSNASNGAVALAGGSVAFTPAANFSGVAGFDYTVSDGALTATAHVTVTVTPVNDAPSAGADVASGDEDVPVILADTVLLANDSDPEGSALTLVSVGNASNGTVTIVAAGARFTAPPNYSGPASFEYTISDGLLTAVGTVTLTILPVNDAPTPVADAATTNEDVAVTLSPLVNDLDVEGDALSLVAVGTPANGTVTFANNMVTYTPAANYAGPDSFTYTASDAGGAMGTGTISITVVPVADPPTATNDTATVAEDTSIVIAVLANDFDVDGQAVSLVSAGAATSGTTLVVGNQVQYTPNPNYFGPDMFTYVIADAGGTQATATVSITVTPVDDPPGTNPDFYAANDEIQLTVAAVNGVLANDSSDSPLTATLLSPPQYGTLSLAPDGSFTYTADGCVYEDTFTYQATDGVFVSAPTTVTFSINHAPYGWPDRYFMVQNQTLTTQASCNTDYPGVLCNDMDVDLDPLTATLASPPANAQSFTFQSDGSFTYQPSPNFIGGDPFSYTVSDGVLTQLVTVNINVQCGAACSVPAMPIQEARALVAERDTETGTGTAHGIIGPVQKCCLVPNGEDPPTIGLCEF